MNTYEAFARALKVGKLADLLDAHGITAEQAIQIEPAMWAQLARAARTKAPSATSIEQIVYALRERANLRQQAATTAA